MTGASFWEAYSASENVRASQESKKRAIKNGNRIAGWFCGIIVGLFPYCLCWILKSAYKYDLAQIEILDKYLSDFIYSGSFLWLSITLLVVSWIDMLLYGVRDDLSPWVRKVFKVLMAASGVMGLVSSISFGANIIKETDRQWFFRLSLAAFILFALVTLFFTLKIVRED